MPVAILMPALSPTMKEGNLICWHKKTGDTVGAGDLLAEIETDKATMEVEAVDEGTLAALLIPAGTQNVAVNSPLAVLLEDGETEDDLKTFLATLGKGTQSVKSVDLAALQVQNSQAQNSQAQHLEAPHPAASTPIASDAAPSAAERTLASPLARRVASTHQVPLETISGTGPRGRIVHQDVLNALNTQQTLAKSPQPGVGGGLGKFGVQDGVKSAVADAVFSGFEPPFVDLSLTPMRKTIARRLSESKQTVPHFYVSSDVVIDRLLDIRQELNRAGDIKISVNDFVIAACARSLRLHPEVNAAWAGDTIRLFQSVDIAIAVAVDNGLFTPVIRGADTKGLESLSQEMKALASKARQGKLRPEEFQGGTFSISNLGMFGVDTFTAIINPPQAAILAVGAGVPKAIVQDGEIVVATVMSLTLSLDHRVIDGALGARFLKTVKDILEHPARLLL